MATFRKKRNINIGRVVSKIAVTVIALYAGGIVITQLGVVMNGTCSPFYQGLTLIGWAVGSATCSTTGATNANTITATTNTGILAVVGVLGIASVVMEFVKFRM